MRSSVTRFSLIFTFPWQRRISCRSGLLSGTIISPSRRIWEEPLAAASFQFISIVSFANVNGIKTLLFWIKYPSFAKMPNKSTLCLYANIWRGGNFMNDIWGEGIKRPLFLRNLFQKRQTLRILNILKKNSLRAGERFKTSATFGKSSLK